jgi:pimeloyl-ACP methyl ester carboxylesterase
LPVKPKALFVLASPAGFYEVESEPGNDCGSFAFTLDNMESINKKVGRVVIMHSEDDFVVPYDHALKLKEALPEAELVTFTDRNHFLQEEFPELVKKIKEIAGK